MNLYKPTAEEVDKYGQHIIDLIFKLQADIKKRTDLPLWAKVCVMQLATGILEVELKQK